MDWYTGTLPRRFRSHYSVQRVGRFPRKRGWVDNRFDTVNFSFVLSGAGEYRLDDVVHQVSSPCVITQWPDQHFNYGPFDVWDELFICFAARCMHELIERGLLNLSQPVWYLRDPGPVLALLDRLTGLLLSTDQRCVGDRIDLLAESIVMESLIRTAQPALRREQRLVREAAKLMNQHLSQPFDFNGFAHRHGIHPATLRRVWMRTFTQPPLQYHMELRMQHACNLLGETPMSVKQIGLECGFSDQLYFSRYFRKRMGLSPLRFRRRIRGVHKAPNSISYR
ncbi:MAG: helix-turn-helix domain-containing protein [Chitinivibrionales bacterium]|nr:helix-turn-helix domain-containing protein [Chitinivibrionales bacterium]